MIFRVKVSWNRDPKSGSDYVKIHANSMEVHYNGTLQLFDETTVDGKHLVAAFTPDIWLHVVQEGAIQ